MHTYRFSKLDSIYLKIALTEIVTVKNKTLLKLQDEKK